MSSKENEVFQSIVTIENYLLQYEQNISKIVHALYKVKDMMHFDVKGKKSLKCFFFKRNNILYEPYLLDKILSLILDIYYRI